MVSPERQYLFWLGCTYILGYKYLLGVAIVLGIQNWGEAAAFISVVTALIGAGFVILYLFLRSKMDGVYVKYDQCKSKHEVSDVMIKSLRDDISEMKNTNNKILDILLEARNGLLPKSKSTRGTKRR